MQNNTTDISCNESHMAQTSILTTALSFKIIRMCCSIIGVCLEGIRPRNSVAKLKFY